MVTQEQQAELERLIGSINSGHCKNGAVLARCDELYQFVLRSIEGFDEPMSAEECDFAARGLQVVATTVQSLGGSLVQFAFAFQCAAAGAKKAEEFMSKMKVLQ